MRTSSILWVVATQCTEILAFFLLRSDQVVPGMLAYGGVAYLFHQSMQGGGLALANGLWNAFSNLSGAFIGVYFFDEELSPKKIMGIALGVFSAVILGSDD